MRYVDGFVIPVAKKSVPDYVRLAKKAGRIWREHGALEVFCRRRAHGQVDVVSAQRQAQGGGDRDLCLDRLPFARAP
jgi:uncharacterized protein YbaA (DUF1428 family)